MESSPSISQLEIAQAPAATVDAEHFTRMAMQNAALFEELQAQRTSVIRLNALKDDLIAALAHDFKGPLTTILGYTELLEQTRLDGEDARDALRTIRQAAARLTVLANDTLELSRVEHGDLNVAADPVDVSQLVRETIESFTGQCNIALVVKASDPIVRGDPSRLRQVFENVIGNAIKYSPGGGPIDVTIAQTEQALRVSVRDCGIGIPPNEMKLLFERFRRASNAKRSKIKGTGLGLYIAKTLVERHGGTIHVESTLDVGSTFTVILPRAREGAGGLLRVALLSADDRLAPFVLYELRRSGQAARHDATLSALLERLDVEPFDVAIVDCETIDARLQPLFKRAEAANVGLVGIGARNATEGPWHVHLSKPFLASDLRHAIALADRARMAECKRSKN